jgi:hypothetical protein
MSQKVDPKSDPLFKLKHIGYVMAVGAPRGKGDLEDLVQNCKFMLCHARGYLMEDPVWDKYTDEQILTEYFAMEFRNNNDFRKEFEALVPGYDYDPTIDEFLSWSEGKIEENAKELKTLEETKEEFEFTPASMGEV